MTQQRNILWIAAMPALVLAGVAAVAIASPATIPNTFTPNTVADANQVNANFQSMKTAIDDNDTRITANTTDITANTTTLAGMPQVWAVADSDFGGTTVLNSGPKQMASVAISAPSNGFLLISGQVFINNAEASDTRYVITAEVDGTDVSPDDWLSLFYASADGSLAAEFFTLNFTVTVPITAGAHTVDMLAGPFSGTADFFHNREELSVVFIPTGVVTPTPSPLLGAAPSGSDTGD